MTISLVGREVLLDDLSATANETTDASNLKLFERGLLFTWRRRSRMARLANPDAVMGVVGKRTRASREEEAARADDGDRPEPEGRGRPLVVDGTVINLARLPRRIADLDVLVGAMEMAVVDILCIHLVHLYCILSAWWGSVAMKEFLGVYVNFPLIPL